jgi:hypothetical protein
MSRCSGHKALCLVTRVKKKVKVSLRYEDVWGSGCIDPRFLHLAALFGGEWSASRTGRFTPGTHWVEPVWTTW